MPNWCSTNYAIKCENEELLKKICGAINKCALTPRVDLMSDPYWVGNVFKELGLELKGDRSFWQDAKIEDGVLKFFEYSAWSRGCGVVMLQEHYLSDNDDDFLEVYFVSLELGMGVYETNDESGLFFPERYLWSGPQGEESFDSFEELKEEVQHVLRVDTDFKNVDEIRKALAEEEEFEDDSIYEIEFTDL